MAVSGKWYTKAQANMMKGLFDLEDDTIKVMLCTSSYTLDKEAHEFKDDITNEVVGAGYTAGGATLANKAISSPSAGVTKFDADDAEWAASTITARYAIIYKDTGVDSTSPLLGYVDFGEDKITTSTVFRVQWSPDGVLTLTQN